MAWSPPLGPGVGAAGLPLTSASRQFGNAKAGAGRPGSATAP